MRPSSQHRGLRRHPANQSHALCPSPATAHKGAALLQAAALQLHLRRQGEGRDPERLPSTPPRKAECHTKGYRSQNLPFKQIIRNLKPVLYALILAKYSTEDNQRYLDYRPFLRPSNALTGCLEGSAGRPRCSD